ncbi:hypothetical protein DPEC_G00266260 [Dallia pectoralis]|uniref:Uncharacterized protein n=1 Tax=Dallia pectoralis TaxID=75939 RepID=A0ACC2FNC0_DALPE|nr:hypothetical protein DPEC_G00266260 [Dallia pectoralis]
MLGTLAATRVTRWLSYWSFSHERQSVGQRAATCNLGSGPVRKSYSQSSSAKACSALSRRLNFQSAEAHGVPVRSRQVDGAWSGSRRRGHGPRHVPVLRDNRRQGHVSTDPKATALAPVKSALQHHL